MVGKRANIHLDGPGGGQDGRYGTHSRGVVSFFFIKHNIFKLVLGTKSQVGIWIFAKHIFIGWYWALNLKVSKCIIHCFKDFNKYWSHFLKYNNLIYKVKDLYILDNKIAHSGRYLWQLIFSRELQYKTDSLIQTILRQI